MTVYAYGPGPVRKFDGKEYRLGVMTGVCPDEPVRDPSRSLWNWGQAASERRTMGYNVRVIHGRNWVALYERPSENRDRTFNRRKLYNRRKVEDTVETYTGTGKLVKAAAELGFSPKNIRSMTLADPLASREPLFNFAQIRRLLAHHDSPAGSHAYAVRPVAINEEGGQSGLPKGSQWSFPLLRAGGEVADRAMKEEEVVYDYTWHANLDDALIEARAMSQMIHPPDMIKKWGRHPMPHVIEIIRAPTIAGGSHAGHIYAEGAVKYGELTNMDGVLKWEVFLENLTVLEDS